jgi:mannitol/fructose-specific phosphotransferase system IIA component (Ntr-type)
MSRDGQRERIADCEAFRDPPADTAHDRETAILRALVRILAQEAARDAFREANNDRDKSHLV